MAGTICDVCDEVLVLTLLTAEQTVDSLDEYVDDVYVFPFVEAADVVSVGNLSFVENEVDGTSVVFYIEPVAHILTLSVDRQRFAVTDVIDKQRNELFGELIRTIVVGTVGHDGRHAIGVVEGTHEVVAACL